MNRMDTWLQHVSILAVRLHSLQSEAQGLPLAHHVQSLLSGGHPVEELEDGPRDGGALYVFLEEYAAVSHDALRHDELSAHLTATALGQTSAWEIREGIGGYRRV